MSLLAGIFAYWNKTTLLETCWPSRDTEIHAEYASRQKSVDLNFDLFSWQSCVVDYVEWMAGPQSSTWFNSRVKKTPYSKFDKLTNTLCWFFILVLIKRVWEIQTWSTILCMFTWQLFNVHARVNVYSVIALGLDLLPTPEFTLQKGKGPWL